MNGRPVLQALPRDRDDRRQTGYEQMHAMPVPERHQQHNRTESAHGSPTRGGLQPSHVLLFVLLGLVLVIGSTVGALTWRSTSIERSIPAWDSADPAAGYAFYDELRQLLAGDQTADLRGVVTTGFLDHTSDQEEPRDIEDLTTELTTFGATFPGTLLTIDSISISGNSLVVMISGTMSPVGSVVGLGLSPIRLPATIEILHTHQGRVSERWAAPLPRSRQ